MRKIIQRLLSICLIAALLMSVLSMQVVFGQQQSKSCKNENDIHYLENIVQEDVKQNEEIQRYTVLILDTSGSMSGEPLNVQKQAAIKFCDTMLKSDGRNLISIIQLNSYAKIGCEFTSDLNILESCIDNTRASGGTNMNDALISAETLLNAIVADNSATIVKNIVLCTDGRPNNSSAVMTTANSLKGKYNLYTLGFFHSLSGDILSSARKLLEDIASKKEWYYEVVNVDNLEFTFGVIADEITQDNLKRLYVNQHIKYIDSENYSNDIQSSYDGILSDVMEDIEKDMSVKLYNDFDFLNQFIDVHFDVTSEYELLLAQMMLNDQSYQGLQNVFSVYLEQTHIEGMQLICEMIDSDVEAVHENARKDVKRLFSELTLQEYFSDDYNRVYKEYCNSVNKITDSYKVSQKLKDAGFVLDIGGIVLSTASETLEYMATGEAYLKMSEDFVNALGRLDAAYYDHTAQGIPENINLAAFLAVSMDFRKSMRDYKNEGAADIARKAKSSFDGSIYGLAVDTLYEAVPILGQVQQILKGGKTIIDLLTDIDDRACSGNMVEKLYWISCLIDTACDASSYLLKKEDNMEKAFDEAAVFDELVNMYKVSKLLACDYGIEYEKYVQKDLRKEEKKRMPMFTEFSFWTPYAEGLSWCSSAIAIMSLEKEMIKTIQCHSEGIIYNHKEPITYNPGKLKIFTVACPVNVTVKNNNGQKIAFLSDSGNEIVEGYEHYFLTLFQKNSNEKIKIAMIPENYELLLTGTDNGSMDLYIGVVENNEITSSEIAMDIPVTQGMYGSFKSSAENTDLYDLVIDGKTMNYSKELKPATGAARLNIEKASLQIGEKLQLKVEILSDTMDNINLKWSSSDENIVNVDGNGVVRGVNAGRATVTAESMDGSDMKVYCSITVVANGYYIVSFNANGGTSLSRKTITLLKDDEIGILPNTKRKNYEFEGWYTQQQGGTEVNSSTVLNNTMTLYAHWKKIEKPTKIKLLILKPKSGQRLKIKFEKISDAKGYQIVYSTDKSFVGDKTKKIIVSSNSKILSNLRKGDTYYVKVRAYKTDSFGNKIYGSFCKKQRILIKK